MTPPLFLDVTRRRDWVRDRTDKVWAAVATAICLLGFMLFSTLVVRERSERWYATQRACRAELSLAKHRSAFLERFVLPDDPCLALRLIKED